MAILDVREATLLIHSYGMKCDKYLVEHWLKEGKLKGIEMEGTYMVEDNEVYDFLEDYR